MPFQRKGKEGKETVSKLLAMGEKRKKRGWEKKKEII